MARMSVGRFGLLSFAIGAAVRPIAVSSLTFVILCYENSTRAHLPLLSHLIAPQSPLSSHLTAPHRLQRIAPYTAPHLNRTACSNDTTRSFVCSFVRSFVRSFVCSFIRHFPLLYTLLHTHSLSSYSALVGTLLIDRLIIMHITAYYAG
jgi:hypothetical protein